MKDFYSFKKWYAYDVETTGDKPEYALQPWSERGRMRSFAVASRLNKKGLLSRAYSDESSRDKHNMLHCLTNFARSASASDVAVVGWNVAFDAAWMIHMGLRDYVMDIRWVDAMLLWKHLTRVPESDLSYAYRKSYSLKAAVAEYYPEHADYADGIDFDGDIHTLMEYNCADAEFTLKLAQKFWDELAIFPDQLRAAWLESSCIPLVADAYVNGIHIDLGAATDLQNKLDADLLIKKHELAQDGVTPEIIASPLQLRELFFKKWELKPVSYTPKGEPSTDAQTIHELSITDDRVREIGEFRQLKNLRTKFVNNIIESCRYSGGSVSHPTPNVNGTYTGRMTYSSHIGKNKDKRQTGFALHQMKRDSQYRRVIVPPPGFTLIEWDAAGQEYRWMAIESDDETMLELCEPGEDPHAYMGANISGWNYGQLSTLAREDDPEAKRIRQMGKVGNLSCQYRIGPKSLLRTARVGHKMDITMEDAKLIHDTYHRTYPGVKAYWKRKIKFAADHQFAKTIAGRRVHLLGDFNDPEDGWRLQSTAVNFPIQGVGADQKYLAMLVLKPLFVKTNTRFAWELHDGLFAVAPDKLAKSVAVKGQQLLNNLPYQKAWGFTPPIPLPWDVKIGKSWGDLKEIN